MVQHMFVETLEDIARTKSAPTAYMGERVRGDPQDIIADGGLWERGTIRFSGVWIYGYRRDSAIR